MFEPPSSADLERKERERQFHNERFAHETRHAVTGFYAVLESSSRYYESELFRRAAGKVVLEYGCGPGTYSFRLAPLAERVVGIDLSDVAIQQARDRARQLGAANTEFHVMDAENLTFPPATFDLVCGRAIVHHLDLHRCFATVARVLKPEGVALFYEPLGHNPIIQLYRRRTPHLRTLDEHPLLMRDLRLAGQYFRRVHFRPFALFSLLAAPLRNTFLFRPLLRALDLVDRAVLSLPYVGRYAWTSIWVLEGPKNAFSRPV